MLSAEENHHKRRLLVAGFDWPPGRSPGRNPGPLCDSSVSVFVPRSSNYAQLHVFIWEWMGGGGERGRWRHWRWRRRVKESFWRCTLQFRSCSAPTQIKTSPVAYVNTLPTALRFNEPRYERHRKPMENNWPLKGGVRLTGDRWRRA